MNAQQTEQLLISLATLGAGIATGVAPAAAGGFALQAIVREAPHIIGLASIVLATGKLTDEQKAQARAEALALSGGLAAIPAA